MMEAPSRSKMALAFQVAAGNVEKKKNKKLMGKCIKGLWKSRKQS